MRVLQIGMNFCWLIVLTIFLLAVSHQSHQTPAKWHPSKTSALWLTGRLGNIQYIDAWWMWSTLQGI